MDKKTKRGDTSKLGNYSRVDIILHVHDGKGYVVKDLIILNAYTQFDYKWHDDTPPVDYTAIESVFKKINHDFKGKKVGIPLIGSGLAGGYWDEISEIIDNETKDLNITIVEFTREE